MKRLSALLLAIVGCNTAKAAISPAENLIVEELQVNDSGRYRVTWVAPIVDPSHITPTGYHLRLIRDSAFIRPGAKQDTLVFHQLPSNKLVDTVTIARPLTLNDSIPLRVVVRSVSCVGTNPCVFSGFTTTSTWFLKFKLLGPNPPGPINIDTLALSSITIRPAVVAVSVGNKVQLCAFGTLIDGTKGMIPWGRVAGQTDSIALDTTGYCLDQFNKWLTETQG